MAQVTEQQIFEALKTVRDEGKDIVSQDMVADLWIEEGHVFFALRVEAERGPHLEPLRQQAEEAVLELPGVKEASVILTAERQASPDGGAPGPAAAHGAAEPSADQPLMPGVRSIVAVASGKGGVGKSTTAVNLALALAAAGHSVGLLDADIYGPSIPRMLGIGGHPTTDGGSKMKPLLSYGIKCMSIGFLIEENTPLIWRGPMVMGALEQMMRDVAWGDLEIMVVDLPPGTGDAQLTMAQRVPLSGAVIVSTPQDIALADARRGLAMFEKVDVEVYGIVENMSYFLCPHCNGRSEIFSHGGARQEAQRMGTEFLGEIPLDIAIREAGDGGHPIVVSDPESDHAKAYRAIAEAIWEKAAKAGA